MLEYKRGRGKGRSIKFSVNINLFWKNAPVLDKKEGERGRERGKKVCVGWGVLCI